MTLMPAFGVENALESSRACSGAGLGMHARRMERVGQTQCAVVSLFCPGLRHGWGGDATYGVAWAAISGTT